MLTEYFDPHIWTSLSIGQLNQHELNLVQEAEFNRINKYSDSLISENFNKIETCLKNMRKTVNGYTIYRASSDINWIIKIKIDNNQIEIKRGII
jgi:hypothetical protein